MLSAKNPKGPSPHSNMPLPTISTFCRRGLLCELMSSIPVLLADTPAFDIQF